MTIFNLPDLGEGLPDAEIHEWFVKEGDIVALDQALVSMETAKAVVDVPCPQAGTILKLFGKPGDIIKTGDPLISFANDADVRVDKGTVVGNLEESTEVSDDNFTVRQTTSSSRNKATPAVRMLAKKHKISLDAIKGSGDNGIITLEDVRREVEKLSQPEAGFEPLRGVRRAMLASMVQSHENVVPVSLFDEADIACWATETDITVRLIQAISFACTAEPSLNAWFDSTHSARKCFEEIHLGLAMDTEDGLFVPVIQDVANLTSKEIRTIINDYKQSVTNRSVPADKLKGATITLSNFGKFAGKFASPIIVPPMVAIIAVGRLYECVVSVDGKFEAHRMLPLSLSFDHRAVTGGEATRFLGAMITSLQSK